MFWNYYLVNGAKIRFFCYQQKYSTDFLMPLSCENFYDKYNVLIHMDLSACLYKIFLIKIFLQVKCTIYEMVIIG